MQRFLAATAAMSAAVMLMGSTALAQVTTIVTVSPIAGTQDEPFTFVGANFEPGSVLDERYITPDGEVVAFMIDGAPAVVNVAEDGSFVVVVNPAVDLAGFRPGTWGVVFCLRDDPAFEAADPDKCFTGAIDIEASASDGSQVSGVEAE